MKEYKYKINGNLYKVTIGNVEDNIADVEVNGTHYKVEMEKAPQPKPVVVKPVVRQPATTPAAQTTQVSKPAAAPSKSGREIPAAGRHPGNQGERGRRGEKRPDSRHPGSHEDGKQHQRRQGRQSDRHQCQAGRLRA